MKKYGIYLAYPPKTNLLIHGLGRYLIELVKNASVHQVRFVIACPSWMRDSLIAYFQAANIDADCYELIGPNRKPFILSLYDTLTKLKNIKFSRRKNNNFKNKLVKFAIVIGKKIVTLRNVIPYPFSDILSLFLLILLSMILITYKLLLNIYKPFSLLKQKLYQKYLKISQLFTFKPKDSTIILHLYTFILEAETHLMALIINRRKDIKAWYCPTPFWSTFNNIKAPRLTCIPDLVLKDFAIAFSILGERYLTSYNEIEKTINGGNYFVTYSQDVKWNTLVREFHQPESKIAVIPHGANQLSEIINVRGLRDNNLSTNVLCQDLFLHALNKALGGGDIYKHKRALNIKFIFYASQFRPNKNIISLLKAYKHLLRKRFIQIKLILTGNPYELPEIYSFIQSHQLENDVLCLYNLTDKELAACYRLATLSVNPSFSEGGCPFTFTESLSVGTPVVMGRIAVTEEIITDPKLQDIMFFDPYDWQDMVDRIEWGLQNRDVLLEKQKELYEQISKRTWAHVVEDHITLLDKIATGKEHNLIEASSIKHHHIIKSEVMEYTD